MAERRQTYVSPALRQAIESANKLSNDYRKVLRLAAAAEPLELPERAATWVAIGYLVVAGSALVFVLYLVVLRYWAASRAAYTFVVIPVITLLLSGWLDDEPIGIGLLLGGSLVLAGVYVGALRRSPSPAPIR